MTLDKAIESGKEHRKQYRGAKRVDPSCRNHGGCPYCEENRLYQDKKIKEIIDYEFKLIKDQEGSITDLKGDRYKLEDER